MTATSKTVFFRSRSGQVRRVLKPSKHLNHVRQLQAKPALLRLPSELRLAIWGLVLTPQTELVCELVKAKPPAVALVCRQMFNEAVPIFFDTRTWFFDVAAELCPIKHDPLAFELFDPSVPRNTADVLLDFPFTYEDDQDTPYPEPGAMSPNLLEHRIGRLPEMASQEKGPESFARLKLAALHHSVLDLQARSIRTVFTSSTWEPRENMPWAAWSWTRYAEHLIQLRNVRLHIHLDRHVYGQHKRWDAGISVIGGPEPKSKKSRCKVEWLSHGQYKKKKKQSLSNLKENLLQKEMQYLLTSTVSLIAQRRNFRGFTLAEVEILASVFLFEKWKCESDSCYHCHGFGDPFWNLNIDPTPPPPLAAGMMIDLDADIDDPASIPNENVVAEEEGGGESDA